MIGLSPLRSRLVLAGVTSWGGSLSEWGSLSPSGLALALSWEDSPSTGFPEHHIIRPTPMRDLFCFPGVVAEYLRKFLYYLLHLVNLDWRTGDHPHPPSQTLITKPAICCLSSPYVEAACSSETRVLRREKRKSVGFGLANQPHNLSDPLF